MAQELLMLRRSTFLYQWPSLSSVTNSNLWAAWISLLSEEQVLSPVDPGPWINREMRVLNFRQPSLLA